MEIKPYKYNILCEVILEEANNVTDSGIVLMNQEQSIPYIRAKVIEVGSDLNQLENIKFDLKAGDIIYVQKMTGVDLSIVKENHIIITPDKIICKEVIDVS